MRGLTRRGFVGALGAAAVGLACGDNVDGGRFAGLAIGVHSWTFRFATLADTLAQTAALGVPRIELSPVHWGFPKTDDEIATMHAVFADHGLTCLTTGQERVTADHEANRALFAYAHKLGLKTIMVDAPPESLDSLEILVAEYGVRVGIHNHRPGSLYITIADVAAVLDGRDERIGAIVDVGHFVRAGEDPIEALRVFEGRVYGVHIKDIVAVNTSEPDAILGEGIVDLVALLRAIRATGVPTDASISVEYEGNPDTPFDDVVVCLDNLAEAARRV